jgi:plasmid stabilization system protein ParE
MVEIKFAPQALEDLDALIEFWAGLSEQTAKFQVQRIRARVETLKDFPRLGRVVPELEYPNVRELIEG